METIDNSLDIVSLSGIGRLVIIGERELFTICVSFFRLHTLIPRLFQLT